MKKKKCNIVAYTLLTREFDDCLRKIKARLTEKTLSYSYT